MTVPFVATAELLLPGTTWYQSFALALAHSESQQKEKNLLDSNSPVLAAAAAAVCGQTCLPPNLSNLPVSPFPLLAPSPATANQATTTVVPPLLADWHFERSL